MRSGRKSIHEKSEIRSGKIVIILAVVDFDDVEDNVHDADENNDRAENESKDAGERMISEKHERTGKVSDKAVYTENKREQVDPNALFSEADENAENGSEEHNEKNMNVADVNELDIHELFHLQIVSRHNQIAPKRDSILDTLLNIILPGICKIGKEPCHEGEKHEYDQRIAQDLVDFHCRFSFTCHNLLSSNAGCVTDKFISKCSLA